MSTLPLITVSVNKGNICATSACSNLQNNTGRATCSSRICYFGGQAGAVGCNALSLGDCLSSRFTEDTDSRNRYGEGLLKRGRKSERRALVMPSESTDPFQNRIRTMQKVYYLLERRDCRAIWQRVLHNAWLFLGEKVVHSFLKSQMSPEQAVQTRCRIGKSCKTSSLQVIRT